MMMITITITLKNTFIVVSERLKCPFHKACGSSGSVLSILFFITPIVRNIALVWRENVSQFCPTQFRQQVFSTVLRSRPCTVLASEGREIFSKVFEDSL